MKPSSSQPYNGIEMILSKLYPIKICVFIFSANFTTLLLRGLHSHLAFRPYLRGHSLSNQCSLTDNPLHDLLVPLRNVLFGMDSCAMVFYLSVLLLGTMACISAASRPVLSYYHCIHTAHLLLRTFCLVASKNIQSSKLPHQCPPPPRGLPPPPPPRYHGIEMRLSKLYPIYSFFIYVFIILLLGFFAYLQNRPPTDFLRLVS